MTVQTKKQESAQFCNMYVIIAKLIKWHEMVANWKFKKFQIYAKYSHFHSELLFYFEHSTFKFNMQTFTQLYLSNLALGYR